jgi:hypothetical protein
VIIDELMPCFDATRVDHLIVDAPLERAYDAVLRADFNEALARSVPVRALVGVRTAIERAVAAVRGLDPPAPAEQLEPARLADMETHGMYVRLGEDPPGEIAFGMIGRFWGGETRWEEIDASEFAGFDRTGYARIACSISLRPYGETRSLLSYEARTQATDAESRRAFLRYWRVASPLAGVVLRAQLGVIADEAR